MISILETVTSRFSTYSVYYVIFLSVEVAAKFHEIQTQVPCATVMQFRAELVRLLTSRRQSTNIPFHTKTKSEGRQ